MENPSQPVNDVAGSSQPNQVEELLLRLEKADKECKLYQFKVERLEAMRQTLTVMLDESVAELENKSQMLSDLNADLSKTLADLQDRNAEIEKQKQELEVEKGRSEKLLLDILPQEVVNELKKFGRSYARKYEQASVLLADIKNFTSIAAGLEANELVSLLDDYFRGFDRIMDRYGIEKIKTIGDAYMCASGLFHDTPTHAVNIVHAAVDMQLFANSLGISKEVQGLPAFQFRIGIHSGAVIAGVVGARKFAYDIWGDTVNMAARMEQNGEPGKINISATTYELIKDVFNCTCRGVLPVKNAPDMQMFFVENAK